MEGQPDADLSGVKIETTAKGLAVVTVRVYGDVDEAEMQRRKDLAVRTYETAIRELGQRAEFQ